MEDKFNKEQLNWRTIDMNWFVCLVNALRDVLYMENTRLITAPEKRPCMDVTNVTVIFVEIVSV